MSPRIDESGRHRRGPATGAPAAWLGAVLGSAMLLAACGGDVSADPSGTSTGTGTGGTASTSGTSSGGAETTGTGGAETTGTGGEGAASTRTGGAGGATTGTGGDTTSMPCSADADCPAPPGQCAQVLCQFGECVLVPLPLLTPCNGTCHCDGRGYCAGPGCITDDICPPSPSVCLLSKCVGCEECALVAAPIGTPVSDAPGDCKITVCNGNGATTEVVSNQDVPDDGDPCTVDLCDAGQPVHAPLCRPGQTCDQGVCSP